MKLRVNGDERDVPEGLDLPGLVAHLGLPGRGLLIEHNGEALRPAEWAGRVLATGDQVEIVRMVAGG